MALFGDDTWVSSDVLIIRKCPCKHYCETLLINNCLMTARPKSRLTFVPTHPKSHLYSIRRAIYPTRVEPFAAPLTGYSSFLCSPPWGIVTTRVPLLPLRLFTRWPPAQKLTCGARAAVDVPSCSELFLLSGPFL